MQVENHKEEVPFEHYREKFAALDPAEAVARLGVNFSDGEFAVRLLGVTYYIKHPDFAIRADGDDRSRPCASHGRGAPRDV